MRRRSLTAFVTTLGVLGSSFMINEAAAGTRWPWPVQILDYVEGYRAWGSIGTVHDSGSEEWIYCYVETSSSSNGEQSFGYCEAMDATGRRLACVARPGATAVLATMRSIDATSGVQFITNGMYCDNLKVTKGSMFNPSH